MVWDQIVLNLSISWAQFVSVRFLPQSPFGISKLFRGSGRASSVCWSQRGRPLAQIAALHLMLRPPFASFCNPAIFTKLWTAPAALQLRSMLGFTSVASRVSLYVKHSFPYGGEKNRLSFPLTACGFSFTKIFFPSHLRVSLVNSFIKWLIWGTCGLSLQAFFITWKLLLVIP